MLFDTYKVLTSGLTFTFRCSNLLSTVPHLLYPARPSLFFQYYSALTPGAWSVWRCDSTKRGGQALDYLRIVYIQWPRNTLPIQSPKPLSNAAIQWFYILGSAMGCLLDVLRELKNKIPSCTPQHGPQTWVATRLQSDGSSTHTPAIHIEPLLGEWFFISIDLYHVNANWCFDLDSLNYI